MQSLAVTNSPTVVDFDTRMNMDNLNIDVSTAYEGEGLFENLQEFFEEMEGRILISSVVQEAVSKGVLKAIEEESCIDLAKKDVEIGLLQDKLKEKDASISNLQKVLGIVEHETSDADNVESSRSKLLWDFLQESQKKWQESEVCVVEKEKELEHLASSMASMASILDTESKRASLLEKQLNDLKEQEVIKTGQISSFQQEIVKLKLDNSRLKRQARLKGLQFDESMERTQVELHQLRLASDNILQEKKAMEMALDEKSRAYVDMELDHESELRILEKKVEGLSMVMSMLQEEFEGEKLRHKSEEELVSTYVGQQMNSLCAELVEMNPTREQMGSSEDPSRAEILNDMSEVVWKADAEDLIVQVVMEGWYKELTEMSHKLTFELAWKDEEIFYRDGELGSLKQAVEELENDYATLMSICLTLFRDQTDNDSRGEPAGLAVHELDRQKLIELSEFLSSRDAPGGQEENEELAAQQLEKDLKREIVSEVFKQELPLEISRSKVVAGAREKESAAHVEFAEQLASQRLQHELELEIVSEVFSERYQEVLVMPMDSKLSSISAPGPVDTHEKKVFNNIEELEAHLESFWELEACRLERIRTGCSTSIAKCEFKLDKLMRNLADQVNEMKAKITFVQDAIKQQEWKHMLEEDILVLVLRDALAEMHRNLKFEEPTQHGQDGPMRAISCEDTKRSQHVQDGLQRGFSSMDMKSLPVDSTGVSLSPDARTRSGIKSQKTDGSQQSECGPGIQDKDKLILHLKRDIEELRKEKGGIELKLDDITEELYCLRRKFWKEKEIWVSKMSQPQRKEVEAQVNALARHASTAFEEEFKKFEEARMDALGFSLRKEWHAEKENLLMIISQKQVKIEGLELDLVRLKEKEKTSCATEAGLLASIADLRTQVESSSSEKLTQEFLSAKSKQEWQSEKESLKREVNGLLEKDCSLTASVARLSARNAELETQNKSFLAHIAELENAVENSRLASLDHDASISTLKKQYQEEQECLFRVTSEREDLQQKLTAFLEQEKQKAKQIEELETEKARLTSESTSTLKKQYQEEQECLLRFTSEKEDLHQKLTALSEQEKQKEKLIEELETEKARLFAALSDKEQSTSHLTEEKEIAFALAVKEKTEEEKRRSVLESQVQGLRLEVKNLQGVNDKVVDLECRLKEIPRQLELQWAERVEQLAAAFKGFEEKVIGMVQEKSSRIDRLKGKCRSFKVHSTKFAMTEAQCKQRLAVEISNLQKAEAEVDVLGDEVESLLDVLEEVQDVFDLYAPVLRHYPKMSEVAKFVKQEIQLRIDPKYGQ